MTRSRDMHQVTTGAEQERQDARESETEGMIQGTRMSIGDGGAGTRDRRPRAPFPFTFGAQHMFKMCTYRLPDLLIRRCGLVPEAPPKSFGEISRAARGGPSLLPPSPVLPVLDSSVWQVQKRAPRLDSLPWKAEVDSHCGRRTQVLRCTRRVGGPRMLSRTGRGRKGDSMS